MSEQGTTGTGTGTEGAGGTEGTSTGQAGTGTEGAGAAGTEATGTESTETRSAEELAAELKRVNAESAQRRQRLTQLEAEKAEADRAKLGEVDALKKDVSDRDAKIADLEAKLAKRDLGDEVATVAAKLGFRNPAIAGRLVDLEAVKDDDGKVDRAKVEKALKDALKADPYLGGGQSNDGGARTTGDQGGKTDMNTLIRKGAGVIQ